MRIPLILKLVAALAILIALAGTLGAMLVPASERTVVAPPEPAPARAAAIRVLFPLAHPDDRACSEDVRYFQGVCGLSSARMCRIL